MASAFGLVVGLGNPGTKYSDTRHNAGFWFVDSLAAKFSLSFHQESKHQAEICKVQTQDIHCWLCKPTIFMNHSGTTIKNIASFYQIPIETILIAHDELDLKPGIIRLKQGGSHGGHNGLKDIIEKTRSNQFTRMRIGIGHPGSKAQVTPYVLTKPPPEDRLLIEDSMTTVLDLMPGILAGKVQKAMNTLHRRT